MGTKFLYFIVLVVVFNSCCPTNKSKTDSVNSEALDDNYEDVSHFSDTLTDDEYHQMILNAIAKGDRELFAKMVSYPLHRDYPIPDIENEQQMICYFDTLFDESFRKRVAELDSNSWKLVGWRGWMILDGEIWDKIPRITINYTSPIEKQYAVYLKKKDMARLHPSLRGNWEPYDCWLLDGSGYSDFDYSYARVDISTDYKTKNDPIFRIALYKKDSNASDIPSIVLLGILSVEGSAHYKDFYFKSDSLYAIVIPEDPEDGRSYFVLGDKQKDSKKKYIVPCKSCMQPF